MRAGQLADKMDALWKSSRRRYTNALNQYVKLTRKQLRTADGHEAAEAAQEELQEVLKLQVIMREERSRLRKYRNYSAALRNFYRRAAATNNDNQGISTLVDPATNETTEDQERILNIFREHHATKCTDTQVNLAEEAATDPPLTSNFLEVIARRYSYPVDKYFPPRPLDENYPMADSQV